VNLALQGAASSQPAARVDYDIVYVRAPRAGDDRQIRWSDVFAPYQSEPGSDLVLLHPNGSEEVLVAAGNDAVSEPVVSFDGTTVFYAQYHYSTPTASGLLLPRGSDIYKIDLASRAVTKLTDQRLTPHTGVAEQGALDTPVFHLGPCQVPGGKLVFTSTRNGLVASKNYKGFSAYEEYTRGDYKTSQLFVMNEDGTGIEQIGYLNLNAALGPTVLMDGRIAYSSFESEGLRDVRAWGIWTIRPDGTEWAPLFSALGTSGERARHFVAQRSTGKIVVEQYYIQQNHGFGTLYELEPTAPAGEPYFGSAAQSDPRNLEIGRYGRLPFSPRGIRELTPFAADENAPAKRENEKDEASRYLGKVTHPAPAPDNALLVVWSPGPVYGILSTGRHRFHGPAIDSGIYQIRTEGVVRGPDDLALIHNDPKYNEKWPRAVVPYRRIYGIDAPAQLAAPRNDGTASAHLPAGSPAGLFGAPSLYKRESYPSGRVLPGATTATTPESDDPHKNLGGIASGIGGNWISIGADVGLYDNSEIYGIRVLAMEPTTDPQLAGESSRRWWNIANERFRILGEISVRKFNQGKQPLDPDGNPDTSFLVKLPADTAWTLQTIDSEGRTLNMAQTWHMLRPGEVRTNCGSCHAHSQLPTRFEDTAAAAPGYSVLDLTERVPLLAHKSPRDAAPSWDDGSMTGLRFVQGPVTVEFERDVRPILDRSCVPCHQSTYGAPAGNLDLGDRSQMAADSNVFDLLVDRPPRQVPGDFVRLAADGKGKFGHAMGIGSKLYPNLWFFPQASRYVRYFQSRRSLLVWKIYGKRLDGFRDEDFAHQTRPGDVKSMVWKGRPFDLATDFPKNRSAVDLAFTGSEMPPREAVEGEAETPDGRKIHVPPLSDEDRRTIVRWIDLGCPIDLTDSSDRRKQNVGWFADDAPPIVALAELPPAGSSSRGAVALGFTDYESGVDEKALRVTADCKINGAPAGTDLSSQFVRQPDGARILSLQDVDASPTGIHMTAVVVDRAGNKTVRERTIYLPVAAATK